MTAPVPLSGSGGLSRRLSADASARPSGPARLYVDESEALPAMMSAIGDAKRSIDIAMFSWEPDGAGRTIADAVMAKARSGVSVRVQVDQVGSVQMLPFGKRKSFLDEMREAGVDVAINTRWSVNDGVKPVDHRKLIVVDDRIAITGGMNFSHRFGKWHDVMMSFSGPAAAVAGAGFTRRFEEEGGVRARPLSPRAPVADAVSGATQVRLLLNNPVSGQLDATAHMLESIRNARSRVWIQTPFLTDPEVTTALQQAAARGVDTRITVSGKEAWIGTKILGYIGKSYYPELVGAGVKVYEQPGMSHAKVMLIDDAATVGSMNMSRRATLWDHELNVAVEQDSAFRQQVQDLFETDFARSRQVGPTDLESREVRTLAAVRKLTGLKY